MCMFEIRHRNLLFVRNLRDGRDEVEFTTGIRVFLFTLGLHRGAFVFEHGASRLLREPTLRCFSS